MTNFEKVNVKKQLTNPGVTDRDVTDSDHEKKFNELM